MRRIFLVLVLALPAVGQTGMFRANGHELYLNCVGERHGAVVVLAAGAGRTAEDWSKVQPEIAKFTAVCSYDRLGYGKSEGANAHDPGQSMDAMVDDLGALLQAAKVAPPYVMVGHSAGGMLVRWFETRHPGTVVGLVLVDSVHEEQLWRFYAIDPGMLGPGAMSAENQKKLGAKDRLEWHTEVPLIVLRHGKPFQMGGDEAKYSEQVEAAMQAMQRDLAGRSPKGELRVATKSDHFIQLDEPELVIQAVRDVWVQATAVAK